MGIQEDFLLSMYRRCANRNRDSHVLPDYVALARENLPDVEQRVKSATSLCENPGWRAVLAQIEKDLFALSNYEEEDVDFAALALAIPKSGQ